MSLATITPILFLSAAFALATILEPKWSGFQRQQAKSALEMFLGDGRKLFSSHFFSKADVYFHKGYYPSVFDQMPAKSAVHEGETPEEHAKHADHDEEHVREMDFLGQSRDPIEKFGRNFFVSKHAHMANADTRELLPWFRISAELDPNRVETYTTASYWLRLLKKPEEAEKFLREGWRENPESYEILIELGRVYYFDRKDLERARNVWELALAKWEAQQKDKPEPDLHTREEILAHLADLEEKAGNTAKCISYLEQLAVLSPHPDLIKQQIAERKAKLGK